ncbi:MAG: phosphoesterase [Acidobacteria bacterium]|nr:MAG: phosphoesterase [Acidobacteriota bacterium]
MTRRRFLKGAAALTGGTLCAGIYAWQIEPHWLEIVSRPLPIRALPKALQGKRLVQLSDIHVGARVSDNYVLETFAQVALLQPDIVVLTGDLTSYHSHIQDHVKRIYSHLPHGRLATLAILGNHEYGHGWSDYRAADRMVITLRELGVQVLRNEMVNVSGLQIIGMDDLWAHRFDPKKALADVDVTRAMLALSHNPDTVDLPGWERFNGWILSGHTHGGQCRPPFLPPPLLPVKNRSYTAGEFELTNERKLYINRGVGHLIEVRFNVRPEVTSFELQTL